MAGHRIRRAKCKPTSEVQTLLNQKSAERKLIRLICNNFTENDVVLTLTYKITPSSIYQAQRALTNFLRRIKRLRAKLGLEPLKYITITEVTRHNGRIRHRIIMNTGVDGAVLQKQWHVGFIDVQRLHLGENGASELTTFFVKDRHTYRHWNSSRSLKFI